MRRYTEKSQCYEFLVKFQVIVENGDNSSITSVIDKALQKGVVPPIEVIEHKDKKKQLRQETRYFELGNPFNREVNEKILVEFLLEMLHKSNNLLNMVSAAKATASEGKSILADELKILEMSLNKDDVMRK